MFHLKKRLYKKVLVIQYTAVNNTFLKMHWIIIYYNHFYKNNGSFYQNIP